MLVCPTSSSASLGLADYSDANMQIIWYKSFNVGAKKKPRHTKLMLSRVRLCSVVGEPGLFLAPKLFCCPGLGCVFCCPGLGSVPLSNIQEVVYLWVMFEVEIEFIRKKLARAADTGHSN